ncbi:MAG: hypothetical protein ACLFMT_06075, partial [Halobacteriales archaeon]
TGAGSNQDEYAYLIGKKKGEDAALAGDIRPDTSGETPVDDEFEMFRILCERTGRYEDVLSEIEGEAREAQFWEGAKKGFESQKHRER